MNYRKSRLILLYGLSVCLFVIFAAIITAKNWALIAGVIILIAEMIQFAIFYRCPYCGKSLTCVNGPVPQHCPHCGKEPT